MQNKLRTQIAIGSFAMRFESQLLKGIAPVVVLETLSRGPMYGYELSQAVQQRSGDILSLGKQLFPHSTFSAD